MPIGCASHTFQIIDRDGGTIVPGGTLISVQYSRVLNDASTAQVVIGVSGPGCCADLGSIRSWRHQLHIYRNDSFMWSGYITNVDWAYDRVTVDATDLVGLLDRRVPHATLTYTNADLADIAEGLIEDGLAPDDPGHTVTKVEPAGVTGSRTYPINIEQTADHLRDLSDDGIDFTAVGNNIVILPDSFCEVVGRLSDEDLPEGVTVTEDGAALATRWVVAGSEASSAVGTAEATGTVRDYYGLIEQYAEQTSITDQSSADKAAASRLASSQIVPVVLNTQNVTLSPTANVDVLSLVPGWCLDITTSITCRQLTQRLKITGLQISEDGGSADTPGQERILVQVASTGTSGTASA